MSDDEWYRLALLIGLCWIFYKAGQGSERMKHWAAPPSHDECVAAGDAAVERMKRRRPNHQGEQ